MSVTAIVGANWGDEGKGKITDMLAENADIVVRFQGGANAGHTINNKYGRFSLHLMPSGVFYQNITNVIGNGVAFDVQKFVNELNYLEERGVSSLDDVRRLAAMGLYGAIIGKAYYTKAVTIRDAVEAAK